MEIRAYDEVRAIKNVDNWNCKNKPKLKEFLKDLKLGSVTGRSISNGSIVRYADSLRVIVEKLGNETEKEAKSFLERFLSNKIKNKRGESYSPKSKKEILLIGKTYFNYLNKPIISKVFDIKIKVHEQDFEIITEEELGSLLEAVTKPDKQYLLEMLYRTGMRAEEFHNVRMCDILAPTGNKEYCQVVIRNEHSKTKGRTISIYGKGSWKIIKKYLAVRLEEGAKPNDLVYPLSYYGSQKWIRKLGNRVLGKNIHYHQFRHSSATNLCHMLNRQQLCIYFGWRFSSPMVDRYIQRSGVDMFNVDEKFKRIKSEELEGEIEVLKAQLNNLLKKQRETAEVVVQILNKK